MEYFIEASRSNTISLALLFFAPLLTIIFNPSLKSTLIKKGFLHIALLVVAFILARVAYLSFAIAAEPIFAQWFNLPPSFVYFFSIISSLIFWALISSFGLSKDIDARLTLFYVAELFWFVGFGVFAGWAASFFF